MDEEVEIRGDEAGGDDSQPKVGKYRTPPYIAYRTLQTLLGDLKTHGLPPVIDRSILTRFAGGVQGQLLIALRVLGLMKDDNRPTPALAQLVDTFDTPHFKPLMRGIIETTYPYVFALDLKTATPGMFAKAFSDNLDAKEDVLRKCRTFFLNAARDVGVEIGPRIEKAKFPRARTNGAPRKPKAAKIVEQLPPDGDNPPAPANTALMEKLLEKFPPFDPNWPDPIKEKWFAGFDQFMKKAATDQ